MGICWSVMMWTDKHILPHSLYSWYYPLGSRSPPHRLRGRLKWWHRSSRLDTWYRKWTWPRSTLLSHMQSGQGCWKKFIMYD